MAAKILIADDDQQIRGVLRIALGQGGFRVTEAADGAAALVQVARDVPDLVDRIVGLELGADDYVTKPYNPRAKLAAAGCADAIEKVHGVGVRMGRCSGTAP